MKYFILLFLIIITSYTAVYSDISMQEQYNSGHWFIDSSDNMLTVIGISNPLIRRQDEITAAKEDAAKKIAMYYGIHGNIEIISRTGSNLLDYKYESNVNITYISNYESFIDKLTYDPDSDVLITNEGIFVRFKYETIIDEINYFSESLNNRPKWINIQNKPELSGFITAVGFSRNQRRLKDTIIKSTEDAITRMITDLFTAINYEDISIAGKSSSSSIHSKSEGSLKNFRVIEFWIDPVTRFVYTLAIARTGD